MHSSLSQVCGYAAVTFVMVEIIFVATVLLYNRVLQRNLECL